MMNVPIWITDASGSLVYFNEPTAELIGLSFEEAGDLGTADISRRFELRDLDGSELSDDDRPLVIALERRQPSQRLIRMRASDGVWKVVSDTAIPIIGEGDRHLGALVLLWAADQAAAASDGARTDEADA